MVMSDILGVLNMIILLLKYMFVSMVTFLNLFPGKEKVYGSLNRFECFFLCVLSFANSSSIHFMESYYHVFTVSLWGKSVSLDLSFIILSK